MVHHHHIARMARQLASEPILLHWLSHFHIKTRPHAIHTIILCSAERYLFSEIAVIKHVPVSLHTQAADFSLNHKRTDSLWCTPRPFTSSLHTPSPEEEHVTHNSAAYAGRFPLIIYHTQEHLPDFQQTQTLVPRQ